MNDDERYELARLLSRDDKPSVLEEEEGFDAVMREVQPVSASGFHSRVRRRGLAVTALIAVAAAGLLVIAPFEEVPIETRGVPPGDQAPSDFVARGAPEQSATLELACEPDPQCRVGSTVRFRLLDTANGSGYFGAFAIGQAGVVVWYAPADGANSMIPFNEGTWLTNGVRIGSTQAPGT